MTNRIQNPSVKNVFVMVCYFSISFVLIYKVIVDLKYCVTFFLGHLSLGIHLEFELWHLKLKIQYLKLQPFYAVYPDKLF